jgi:hypothetical protein
MNHILAKMSMMLCFFHIISCAELQIERVLVPDFSWYEPIFFKFCNMACCLSCSQQRFDELAQAAFLKEAEAYGDQVDDRIFLQATVANEIVGYISCQVVSQDQIFISQIAFDPEKYDTVLIKELLFVLFQLMPKVKLISVSCPLFCPDLINLVQELGFVQIDQTPTVDSVDLCVPYELKVHSKCAMCKILYGPDFWESDIDDDSDWGFCNLDEHGDVPASDDDNSSYG